MKIKKESDAIKSALFSHSCARHLQYAPASRRRAHPNAGLNGYFRSAFGLFTFRVRHDDVGDDPIRVKRRRDTARPPGRTTRRRRKATRTNGVGRARTSTFPRIAQKSEKIRFRIKKNIRLN